MDIVDCSIIIPHYNQLSHLDCCLNHVLQQDFQGSVEIIVIDNGSSNFDRLQWAAKFPTVLWLYNLTNQNPYTSRNMGISHAQGKWILLLDAKCMPVISWLQHMVSATHQEAYIVAGKYELTYATDLLRDKVHGMMYLNNEKNVAHGYGVTTGNLLVARDIFEKIGYFKDDDVTGHDIQWTRHALYCGYEIIYAQEAIVMYPSLQWQELLSKISKYAYGVRILNPQKAWSIKDYLPMRRDTYEAHLHHRSLGYLGWMDRLKLWLLVWHAKIKYASARHRKGYSKSSLSHTNSK